MNKILLRRYLFEILAVLFFGFYSLVLLIVASNYYYQLTFIDLEDTVETYNQSEPILNTSESENGHDHDHDFPHPPPASIDTVKDNVVDFYWIFFENHIDAWRVFAIIGMGYAFVNVLLTAFIIFVLITNLPHLHPHLNKLERERKKRKRKDRFETPGEKSGIQLVQANSNSNSNSNTSMTKSEPTENELQIERELELKLKKVAIRNFYYARIIFLIFVIHTTIFAMACFLVLLLSNAVADQKEVTWATRWGRAYFGVVVIPGLTIFIAIIVFVVVAGFVGLSCSWKNPFKLPPLNPGTGSSDKSPSDSNPGRETGAKNKQDDESDED